MSNCFLIFFYWLANNQNLLPLDTKLKQEGENCGFLASEDTKLRTYEKCDEGLECVEASISPNYICIKKIGNNAFFSKLIFDTFF